MRLLTTLRARRDAAYDHQYHHKLRGRLWRAIAGTSFESLHNADHPIGLCFSNPFPPRDMTENASRTLLVASPHRDLLTVIATDFRENPELNIGEMPFEVEEVSVIVPDVGETGTQGVIETGTGVLVRIPPWRAEEYPVVTSDEKHATYWRPEHTLTPLKTQIKRNLDRKHQLFCAADQPGPLNRSGELFDQYELIKTFALPTTVTQGVQQTFVLSKWRFGYEVRDRHHRRHLNLALDTGVGERNALGFGFVNIDQSPDRFSKGSESTLSTTTDPGGE